MSKDCQGLLDALVEEGDIQKLLEIAKHSKRLRNTIALSALKRGKVLRLKRQKSGSVQP
jgi:hypothetical protein